MGPYDSRLISNPIERKAGESRRSATAATRKSKPLFTTDNLLVLVSSDWVFCCSIGRGIRMKLSIWRSVAIAVFVVVIPPPSCLHLVHNRADDFATDALERLLRMLDSGIRRLVSVNYQDRRVRVGRQHRSVGDGVHGRRVDDDVIEALSESRQQRLHGRRSEQLGWIWRCWPGRQQD